MVKPKVNCVEKPIARQKKVIQDSDEEEAQDVEEVCTVTYY